MNVPGTPEYEANMSGTLGSYMSSTGDPAEDYFNQLIQSITGQMGSGQLPANTPKFDEYFNDKLAKESATKQYEPYYADKLSRYIADQETKKTRLQEDTSRGIASLEASGQETEKVRGLTRENTIMAYEEAQRNALSGMAGRGLTFSGERGRTESNLKKTQSNELAAYDIGTQSSLRRINESKNELGLGQTRGLSDIALDTSRTQTDTERAKADAIAASVSGRRDTALSDYYGIYLPQIQKSADLSKASSLAGYNPDRLVGGVPAHAVPGTPEYKDKMSGVDIYAKSGSSVGSTKPVRDYYGSIFSSIG